MIQNTQKYITIIGNIGSGKTTQIELLQKSIPNLNIHYEPFLQNPFLEKACSGENCWFQTQIQFTLDLFQEFVHIKDGAQDLNNKNNQYHLFDRDFTQCEVFINAVYEENKITKDEYNLLMQQLTFFESLVASSKKNNQLYILLDSDPVKCKERIIKRGREFEQNLSIQYLERLHKFQKQFLNECMHAKTEIRIEGKTIPQIQQEIQAVITKFFNFTI